MSSHGLTFHAHNFLESSIWPSLFFNLFLLDHLSLLLLFCRNSLSNRCSANISSKSVACLFIFFMGFFVENLFFMMKFGLLSCSSVASAFMAQEILPTSSCFPCVL